MKRAIGTFLILVFCTPSMLIAQHEGHDSSAKSEYEGQEKRAIKSLSESDIAELKAGEGWGLAKAAELNGVPGPRHVLDMGDQIQLSAEQRQEIQSVFEKMKAEAMTLGSRIIQKEKELNEAFAAREIDETSLKKQVMELGDLYAKLRFVHLSAHLKTIEFLNGHQVEQYNALRGYTSSDPCKEVPEGHDPELWKKHNNCGQ